MARSNFKIHENQYPYFLTCTVVDGIDLFSNPRISQIILDALVHLQAEMQVKIYGFIIMHNHIHLVAEDQNLSESIRRFKSFTAREVIRYLESTNRVVLLERLKRGKRNHKKESVFQVWQEGSYPKQVNTLRKMQTFLDYIYFNPVKAGFVQKPEHWLNSFAVNYLGGEGMIPITLFTA
tara:strand:+ start:52 stop:588 length:537 start_codon:yes stop_codon:yes gene_type:complete